MFDELKEVKYKKTPRFYESFNVKYFQEIKRLKNLQNAKVYLEHNRASTMELFCEDTKRPTILR